MRDREKIPKQKQTNFWPTLVSEKKPEISSPPLSIPEEKPVLSSQLENSALASWTRDPEEQARIQRASVIKNQKKTALREEDLNIPDDNFPAYLLDIKPDPSLFPASSPVSPLQPSLF